MILRKKKSLNAGPINGTGEGVAHSKRWYVALVRMHHEKKVSEPPYEKKYIELTEEDRAKVTGVYHAWQQEGYEETYQNVPESVSYTHLSRQITLWQTRHLIRKNGVVIMS